MGRLRITRRDEEGQKIIFQLESENFKKKVIIDLKKFQQLAGSHLEIRELLEIRHYICPIQYLCVYSQSRGACIYIFRLGDFSALESYFEQKIAALIILNFEKFKSLEKEVVVNSELQREILGVLTHELGHAPEPPPDWNLGINYLEDFYLKEKEYWREDKARAFEEQALKNPLWWQIVKVEEAE